MSIKSIKTGWTGISALAGNETDNGAYESIATVSVSASGGQATVEFTNIPSTFTHLQIRGITRSTRSVTENYMNFQFNNNTTSGNYRSHYLLGNGSSASAGTFGETNKGLIRQTGASATSSQFGVFVIDILDYANTNKLKTIRILNGFDRNGAGEIFFMSTWFNSTSAISEIDFFDADGFNIAQNSHFALYGIR